jgi:hypothetical protein
MGRKHNTKSSPQRAPGSRASHRARTRSRRRCSMPTTRRWGLKTRSALPSSKGRAVPATIAAMERVPALMGTEPQMRGSEVQEAVGWVERYRRRARWFHAAVYITVLLLLATGWWLLLGQEGNPSLFARLTGIPDTSLHKMVGWASLASPSAELRCLGGRRRPRSCASPCD